MDGAEPASDRATGSPDDGSVDHEATRDALDQLERALDDVTERLAGLERGRG